MNADRAADRDNETPTVGDRMRHRVTGRIKGVVVAIQGPWLWVAHDGDGPPSTWRQSDLEVTKHG